jgi:hypothetical protein
MLVVLLLLPLSLAMDDGKFDHGGGGGGGGGLVAATAAPRVALDNYCQQKRPATRDKSIDGHMTACDDDSRWQTTTQQPTNNGSSKHGQL